MELDGLKVAHGGLDQAADDLTRIVARIDARMQRLDAELEPLRSRWMGEAQRAYETAKARWDGAIHQMRDVLADTSLQVTRSNADYRAADARGARSFDF